MEVLAYISYWLGGGSWITLHCFIMSIMLYKARNSNASNFLKITFNFANLVRFVFVYLSYNSPDNITTAGCKGIQYSLLLGTLLFRASLAAFLLLRLFQINGRHGKDKWPSIVMFATKLAFSIPALFTIQIEAIFNPETNQTMCSTKTRTIAATAGGGIVIDFIIDLYVTVRLIQILRGANSNALQLNTFTNSKRSAFTAVMYWNFLRLGVALIYHITGFFEIIAFFPFSTKAIFTIKTLLNIALSYVITVDAEIVRNIEGKDTKKGSSKQKKYDSSSKSMSTTSSMTRSPPRYSSRSSHNPSLAKSGNSDFEDKFTVSMKRLSFFEWANVVVGKRRKDHDDDDISEEDIEVVEVKDESKVEMEPKGHAEKEKDEETIDSTSTLMRDIVLAIDDPTILKDDQSEKDVIEVKDEVKDEAKVVVVIDEPSSNHSEEDGSQKKNEEIVDSTLVSTHGINSVIDESSIIKDNDEIKGSTSISTTSIDDHKNLE